MAVRQTTVRERAFDAFARRWRRSVDEEVDAHFRPVPVSLRRHASRKSRVGGQLRIVENVSDIELFGLVMLEAGAAYCSELNCRSTSRPQCPVAI